MPEPTSHGGLGAEEFAQAGNGLRGKICLSNTELGSWGELFFFAECGFFEDVTFL